MRTIIIVIAIIFFVLAGAGFYFWHNGKGGEASQASLLFEEAVNRNDFVAARKVLAERVNFTVEASDNCGIFEKEKAANDLRNYVSASLPFNFSPDQDAVLMLKENRPDVFYGRRIGIAGNKMLLAYKTGSEGTINDILLAASYELYGK